jgi:hypothetical protein
LLARATLPYGRYNDHADEQMEKEFFTIAGTAKGYQYKSKGGR